jgi:hypothetical protein
VDVTPVPQLPRRHRRRREDLTLVLLAIAALLAVRYGLELVLLLG